jgi:hypothetical protein
LIRTIPPNTKTCITIQIPSSSNFNSEVPTLEKKGKKLTHAKKKEEGEQENENVNFEAESQKLSTLFEQGI